MSEAVLSQDILEFNEEKHFYTLDGKPMAGVSSILKRAGLIDFSGIPEEVLERARQFGVAVHKACEYLDKGTLDITTVAAPIQPYLSAWIKFKEEHNVEILEIEKPVYSKKYWYAGTPDRLALVNGILTLPDLKSSSSVYPSMKLQTAGYQIAKEEMTGQKIKQRMIVQLLKNGSYKIEPCPDENDKNVFLCAVELSKWKRRNGYDRRDVGNDRVIN